jgi:menaquinone-dependent protoporphyrinogen oxidase
MSILVAYDSRHGATMGIAERIGENLREAGHDADVRPVQDPGDPQDYDGFVLGSATYSAHWLKDASAFVRAHQNLLAQRPVWLFSSGPLGTGADGCRCVNLYAVDAPKEVPEFLDAIHPREHRLFCGALDPGRLSDAERSLRDLPAARVILCEGDFRDWDEIQDWAYGIAQEMRVLEGFRGAGGGLPGLS